MRTRRAGRAGAARVRAAEPARAEVRPAPARRARRSSRSCPRPLPLRPIDRQRGVALGLFAEDVSFSYGPLLAEIVAVGATHVALVVPLYQTDATTTTSGCTPGFRRRWPRWPRWCAPPSATDCKSWCSRSSACRRPAPGSGAGRWRRAIATPGSSATAICWASWARSRASPAPRAWSSAASCPRWRTTSTTGGRSSSACAQSFRASSSIRPTGITTVRPACSTWSTRKGSRATSTCGTRRPRPTTRRWRRAGGGRGARSRPGASDAPTRSSSPSSATDRARASPRRRGTKAPGGAPDLDEQRRAFAAFRRVWATAAALDGVYIWNWYGYGGLGTTSYTPRGKPAELEVRSLLGAL